MPAVKAARKLTPLRRSKIDPFSLWVLGRRQPSQPWPRNGLRVPFEGPAGALALRSGRVIGVCGLASGRLRGSVRPFLRFWLFDAVV